MCTVRLLCSWCSHNGCYNNGTNTPESSKDPASDVLAELLSGLLRAVENLDVVAADRSDDQRWNCNLLHILLICARLIVTLTMTV